MEQIDKCSSKLARKLWNIVRIVIYMAKKSLRKSKMIFDLNMLLKRGKSASKAVIETLNHQNFSYSALTCRSDDANRSFLCPREYEFSCSNTPARRTTKRKNPRRCNYTRAEEITVVKKVMEILNRYEASPMNLPGFECSSTPYVVRQLRVTDSPFQVIGSAGEAEDHQVDKDAEDFINKFYKELKNQKRMAALESPLLYHI